MPGHAHFIYTAGPAHGNFKKCVVRVASLSLPVLRYKKEEGGRVKHGGVHKKAKRGT